MNNAKLAPDRQPNALTEAMACGLPCVATRVRCVDELLDEGGCGRVVSLGDRNQITAAIDELLLKATLRTQLGSAARRRACKQHSLENMLVAYDQMYRRLSRDGGEQR